MKRKLDIFNTYSMQGTDLESKFKYHYLFPLIKQPPILSLAAPQPSKGAGHRRYHSPEVPPTLPSRPPHLGAGIRLGAGAIGCLIAEAARLCGGRHFTELGEGEEKGG